MVVIKCLASARKKEVVEIKGIKNEWNLIEDKDVVEGSVRSRDEESKCGKKLNFLNCSMTIR